MIGWYIHHVGLGHLHRAQAVSRLLGCEVTGLSSLDRPRGWRGPWVKLARDDNTDCDPTAGGQLHWAPVRDVGLRARMASLSSWLDKRDPDLIVSDVSTEVALLARLHGVPVVTVVLPGERSDAAHLLGYRISEALVAAWPERARSAATGIPDDIERRIEYVGGLSRVEISDMPTPAAGPRRVTVLSGVGGTTRRPGQLDSARREARGWAWTVLALPPLGTWASDPAPALRGSDVVITHAGQNAIAEVAAVRRPAIVLPEPRPFGEQQATARALVAGQWPATVLQVWPRTGWPRLLEETRSKDGGSWAGWCDGTAAQRFARIIERTVSRSHASRSAS